MPLVVILLVLAGLSGFFLYDSVTCVPVVQDFADGRAGGCYTQLELKLGLTAPSWVRSAERWVGALFSLGTLILVLQLFGWLRRIYSFALSPIIALFLAIIGIGLGWDAFRQIRATEKHLAEISDNLSTVYLGEFPTFLRHIVTLLDEANRSISVACDSPAYGDYSNYEEYINYKAVIERKASTAKVAVDLIIPTTKHRDDLTRFQFEKLPLPKLKASPDFEKFLVRSGRKQEEFATRIAFTEALIAEDRRALEGLPRSVQVIECPTEMPVYAWIVDERSAIFSVPNFPAGGGNESAFRTRDARLIAQLMAILNTYKRQYQAQKKGS